MRSNKCPNTRWPTGPYWIFDNTQKFWLKLPPLNSNGINLQKAKLNMATGSHIEFTTMDKEPRVLYLQSFMKILPGIPEKITNKLQNSRWPHPEFWIIVLRGRYNLGSCSRSFIKIPGSSGSQYVKQQNSKAKMAAGGHFYFQIKM